MVLPVQGFSIGLTWVGKCAHLQRGVVKGASMALNTFKWRRRVREFFKLQVSKETTEQESQRDLFLGRQSFLVPTGQRDEKVL